MEAVTLSASVKTNAVTVPAITRIRRNKTITGHNINILYCGRFYFYSIEF